MTFYRGDGTDDLGRRLEDILLWDDAALEGVHDYIQWLFPLDEPSAFNPDAPLVSAEDRRAFRADPRLAVRLRQALLRMLAFYGFDLEDRDGRPIVVRGQGWEPRSRVWLHPHNHNYLRLTRIMKSLALLGQPQLARALGDALLKEYERAPDLVGVTTARFWRGAHGQAERTGTEKAE